jgi:hypothetical protein
VKLPIEIPTEEPRGKRGRRRRDDEAPKTDEKPKRSPWKEPEGYFQGARVRRK